MLPWWASAAGDPRPDCWPPAQVVNVVPLQSYAATQTGSPPLALAEQQPPIMVTTTRDFAIASDGDANATDDAAVDVDPTLSSADAAPASILPADVDGASGVAGYEALARLEGELAARSAAAPSARGIAAARAPAAAAEYVVPDASLDGLSAEVAAGGPSPSSAVYVIPETADDVPPAAAGAGKQGQSAAEVYTVPETADDSPAVAGKPGPSAALFVVPP